MTRWGGQEQGERRQTLLFWRSCLHGQRRRRRGIVKMGERYTRRHLGWSEKEKRNECTMSFLSRLSYSCILALLCLFRLPMLSHVPMHWCPRWHIKLLCPQQANIGSSHAMPKVSWMPQMALSRSTSPGFRQPSCWIWTAVHVCRVNSGGRRHDAGGRGWLGIPETRFLTCCD